GHRFAGAVLVRHLGEGHGLAVAAEVAGHHLAALARGLDRLFGLWMHVDVDRLQLANVQWKPPNRSSRNPEICCEPRARRRISGPSCGGSAASLRAYGDALHLSRSLACAPAI